MLGHMPVCTGPYAHFTYLERVSHAVMVLQNDGVAYICLTYICSLTAGVFLCTTTIHATRNITQRDAGSKLRLLLYRTMQPVAVLQTSAMPLVHPPCSLLEAPAFCARMRAPKRRQSGLRHEIQPLATRLTVFAPPYALVSRHVAHTRTRCTPGASSATACRQQLQLQQRWNQTHSSRVSAVASAAVFGWKTSPRRSKGSKCSQTSTGTSKRASVWGWLVRTRCNLS